MSPAKKIIIEKIIPVMEEYGYRFYKGSTTFSKKHNNLDYRIRLRFDGRGGLTLLDSIEFAVEIPHYNRIIKQLVGDTSSSLISGGLNYWTFNREIVPVPYSRKALTIANDMNMKELAKIPFEEKYPTERLDSSAQATCKLLKEHAFPFFEGYDSYEKIYEKYAFNAEEKSNPMYFTRYRRRIRANMVRVLYFILIAHDLDKPLPAILYKYKHFYNDMIEGFGHMGKTEHLKKNLQLMGIDYNPK